MCQLVSHVVFRTEVGGSVGGRVRWCDACFINQFNKAEAQGILGVNRIPQASLLR